MSTAIIRVSSSRKDAELCMQKISGEIVFKSLTIGKVIDILEKYKSVETVSGGNINILNEQIIGSGHNYVVIKQPGHKKIVTLNKVAYNINFPNSIYIVHYVGDQIIRIRAYAYKKYNGADTDLFQYPLPNEFSGNSICMGSAKKNIENGDYIAALERIIFTDYSHSTFSGMNGFTQSKQYFEYLEKNSFPYKLIKPLNMKLGSLKV